MIEFLLIFKLKNRIKKTINIVSKKLIIFEKNINKFILIANIKYHINFKESIIFAIVFYANVS